jgi:uncharacterized protein (TIGR02466 family)
LKPYIQFLQHHLEIYWAELGYKGYPKIIETWANKYPTGSFIDRHNHSPVPITVSFYLKKVNNSGNLCFINPLDTLLKHQPFTELTDRNNYHKLFNYEVDVNEGDVVMFPGWLNHETLVNNNADDRIIIGSNIAF